MTKQYWVIGGEYEDTSFSRIRDARAMGPFPTYGQALSVWREMSIETRPRANTRFTIAENAATA